MSVTLHVVTPCMNAAATIDRTILSVITQAGPFRLRYHIQDGGSGDGTAAKLEDWADRIAARAIPRQCAGLQFSHVQEPDAGMYDALVRGIARLGAGPDDFVTWINADDILMPGALALAAEVARQFPSDRVSWFGGSVAILQDDLPITCHDRKIPPAALRAGLCDGEHWEFLQQEGTFFRHWLWASVAPQESIAPMRLAGDWNLWRLFAQKASLVQTGWPLGCFRLREGQLSASQRTRYMEEIAEVLPQEARRAALRGLGASGQLGRRRMAAHYPAGPFYVVEENVIERARERHERVFGTAPDWPAGSAGKRGLFEGRKLPPARVEIPEETVARALLRRPGLVAYDRDWQFPAVTERHAFARMAARAPEAPAAADPAAPEAAIYVGYPWATLIDKLHGRTSDAETQLERFRAFCAALPAAGRRITVCQHVLLRKFLHLFQEAGIAEIFWSHATRADAAAADAGDGTAEGPQLRPFPLYPVQVPEALPEAAPEADAAVAARPYLFSFIGARPDRWYLSQVRAFILDDLADHPRGLVIGRDSWHYQRVVYDLQVRTDTAAVAPETLVDGAAADQFRAALTGSVFALCPSGSGPNSLRLWEAIGAGAIPVILAQDWAPPGDPKLWDAAAVFCDETRAAVQALPARLEAIADDPARLAAMRQALRQLWLLYGPAGFTCDIDKRMQALAETAPAPGAAISLPGIATAAADADAHAAERLLLQAGRLLLGEVGTGAALAEAGTALPADHPTRLHYDRVRAHVAQRAAGASGGGASGGGLAAPRIGHGAVPRIAFLGRHSHRTPLSYPPLRRVVGDRLAFVDDPAGADLVLTGFNLDLRENAAAFAALARRPQPPHVVVLSEEPLWDTVWSGGFTERHRRIALEDVELGYTVLNHDTSDIFAFERIPCFLLTSDDFAPRLAALIGARAALTPQALCAQWQAAPLQAAFFAEARSDPRYAVAFPERDIHGLSLYRTEVARAVAAALPEGRVLCAGQGWGAAPRRQDLPDWHLDKLATLSGRVCIAAAYENTHHPGYISEKIFDAFAVGGIPAYVASPGHRVHALVPEAAMLNSFGCEPAAAAERIAAHRPDPAMAEAWLAAARDLAALFACREHLAAERRRLASACLAEIEAVLSAAPD